MMKKPLVYNIHIEEYAVHRVMRQFHRYQDSPLPVTYIIPIDIHGWTRQGGVGLVTQWGPRMVSHVEMWADALEDLVQEDRLHSNDAFAAYLQWYFPRTWTRLMHVPRQTPTETASLTQTYPRSRDVSFDIAYDVIAAVQATMRTGV
ncbi:uncharacterized protein LOC111256208 [Setaria italica]|uniref:uncharacterized protein LOC111256208 n=1 Tax=Setaria italica TaxID=4555 RepID=UPI000BE52108|nr:uncharacterized protein LOC111256208 [Setaria italica]